MKLSAIIQARMTSTRLPGKVLKEVLGKPLLEYELERVARITGLDDFIVATTVNSDDDPVRDLCRRMGVKCFRGSEMDVLDRYYRAAQTFGIGHGDYVARITADCPLIDPDICDAVIDAYFAARKSDTPVDHMGIDYETLPHGVDIEIFPFESLETAHRDGHAPLDREHVTWYNWHHPELFKLSRYRYGRPCGEYRLTVDTPEDLALVKAVIEELYPKDPHFKFDDVIDFLEQRDDIRRLNENVEQKHFHKGKNC